MPCKSMALQEQLARSKALALWGTPVFQTLFLWPVHIFSWREKRVKSSSYLCTAFLMEKTKVYRVSTHYICLRGSIGCWKTKISLEVREKLVSFPQQWLEAGSLFILDPLPFMWVFQICAIIITKAPKRIQETRPISLTSVRLQKVIE